MVVTRLQHQQVVMGGVSSADGEGHGINCERAAGRLLGTPVCTATHIRGSWYSGWRRHMWGHRMILFVFVPSTCFSAPLFRELIGPATSPAALPTSLGRFSCIFCPHSPAPLFRFFRGPNPWGEPEGPLSANSPRMSKRPRAGTQALAAQTLQQTYSKKSTNPGTVDMDEICQVPRAPPLIDDVLWSVAGQTPLEKYKDLLKQSAAVAGAAAASLATRHSTSSSKRTAW
ncbi:hypothetical protein HaLaN_13798 [Haematococcus lacustris]|uniref:Uncharacterized protein n=1 Tax=Haematococcus lacustris TaxID=44745 RepID=A0A699ZDG2_HAELA|nr:hypothetical protein HaLaN_13798 [Haematococcus lacustris]